jgi:uncharacterized protein (DUF433 family)
MKKYITSKSDIMGGASCIVGTRVPIEVILAYLKHGHSLKKIDKMYPWIGIKRLDGALSDLSDFADKVVAKRDNKEILQAQTTFR